MSEHSLFQVCVTGGSGFVGRNLIRRLRKERVVVSALARSEAAANAVAALGATPARGDLLDHDALCAAMQGCDTVFHAAAKVDEWGAAADFQKINVEGTAAALRAARASGVRCFVHVGTEAVYADGKGSLAQLDESQPVPARPLPRYPATKAAAEALVLAADSPEMRCVSVRPRLIWGNDDTSVLPKLMEAVSSGRFVWADHGHALTSTTHVENVCEGLILAARKGRGGQAYFVSDGDPLPFRDFFPRMLQTRGVEMPDKSVPLGLAQLFASVAESLWTWLPLPGMPPATRMVVELGAKPVVISHAKAARELGYVPVISREEGLSRLGGCAGAAAASQP